MASRLPGTADRQSDAAFDLRFFHYVTGGRSVSANPYWDIVAPTVFEREGRRLANGGSTQGSALLAYAQMILQAMYAYAIPARETIDWVARSCGGHPLVELGAGRGYWAAQLSDAGLAVDAYDLDPPDKVDNVSFPRAGQHESTWYPVNRLDELRLDARPDYVLFLCWPPGWGHTMASDALNAFEQTSGDRLIYIGEPKGGKTGDDAFFEALSDRWRLESIDTSFVSWWNLADVAQCWVRR